MVKRNSKGEITRYRARLIVKGYGQRYGTDYSEVFAHVLRMDSFRILLANTVIHNWDVIGLDVKSTFLHGRIEEELYMTQIPGYEDDSGKYLRIVGSLYALKQAPQVWNKKFVDTVKKNSFQRSQADPLVFF